MRTALLFIFTIATLSSVNAQVDLSGLKGKRSVPTVASIKKSFSKFKKTIKGLRLTSSQKRALANLEQSFFKRSSAPTLKRYKSRGPAWKTKAQKYIDQEYDINEGLSYVDEDGSATQYCKFDDSGVTGMDDHYFVWDAVKSAHRPGKTIAYIVKLVVELSGSDRSTGRYKDCHYTSSEFAFMPTLVRGKPREISDWN